MTNPTIIMGGQEGLHNQDAQKAAERLRKAKTYRDLSTICIVPTRGQISARVVEAWMGMLTPMNQKFIRMMVSGMEVGAAYSQALETILAHPDLQHWRYVLTLEEDNIPPPDGLLRLYESIDDYDAVSGLYWTKGPEGQPMIYGDPAQPLNFIPQLPQPDTVQRCWGIGMGFALWKLDTFRNEKLDKPFFQTVQHFDPAAGSKAYSQDLHACERLGKLGYKFAVDTRVRVGHFDAASDLIW